MKNKKISKSGPFDFKEVIFLQKYNIYILIKIKNTKKD